jgi:hypothetical protein
MCIEAFEITDIASVERAVLQTSENSGELKWWRGHSKIDSSWVLLPAALRHKSGFDFEDLGQFAAKQLNQFILRGAGRLGHRLEPSSDFEWMMLAQHYRLPTQLLDWSESPLVALYFAVTEHMDNDGCLNALAPSLLNLYCGDGNPDFTPNASNNGVRDYSEWPVQAIAMNAVGYKDDAIQARYPRYEWNDIGSNLPQVLAIQAKESDERIVAQIGRFTIHTSQNSVEMINSTISERFKGRILRRYRVPSKFKPSLKDMLERMGFWKWSLFPDLQSLAEGLRTGDI